MKRRLKRELGGDPTTNEVKRQVSDPVDLSQTYESIRRRSTNFPPPQQSPTEKNNNGYGKLMPTTTSRRYSSSTAKQASLSTLVEGDV